MELNANRMLEENNHNDIQLHLTRQDRIIMVILKSFINKNMIILYI